MKKSKKVIITSVLSLVVCCAMLVGTTFAWFTDSASTAVNTIQSGILDVDLVDAAEDGESLVGKTLSFQKAEDHEDEAVLWEPGCKYNLPTVFVKNNGNLALKYKFTVNGVVGGSDKLLEAIDFTVKIGDADPVALEDKEGTLAAGETSAAIVITGHMKEEAGNEYKNLTISGIAITVVATQDTVEFDSYDDLYDFDASLNMDSLFPARASSLVTRTDGTAADVTITKTDPDDDTILVFSGDIPGAAIDENAEEVVIAIDTTTANPNFSSEITANKVVSTCGVTVTGIKADNTELIRIKYFVGKNIEEFTFYHSGIAMNAVASEALVVADQDYYYDSTTGYVTFLSSTFSPFTAIFKATAKAFVGGVVTYFNTLFEAVTAADNSTTVTLLKDTDAGAYVDGKTDIVIDLGGHTVANTDGSAFLVTPGASCSIINGKAVSGSSNSSTTDSQTSGRDNNTVVVFGTIHELNIDAVGSPDAVIMLQSAVIDEISGGSYRGIKNAYNGAYGLEVNSGCTVKLISGGVFEGGRAAFKNSNSYGILSVTGGTFECPHVYDDNWIYSTAPTTNNGSSTVVLFEGKMAKSVTGGTWFGGANIYWIVGAIPNGYSIVRGAVCTAYSQKSSDLGSNILYDDPDAPTLYYYTIEAAT